MTSTVCAGDRLRVYGPPAGEHCATKLAVSSTLSVLWFYIIQTAVTCDFTHLYWSCW